MSVKLRLAHPLPAENAARLGLEARHYPPNAEVELSRENAQAVIGAGYAQVDPEDAKAVAAALGEAEDSAAVQAVNPLRQASPEAAVEPPTAADASPYGAAETPQA